MNLAHFLARACLGLPRPAVSQMPPRWLDVSQMFPRWLPDVTKMSRRCLSRTSLPDVPPRCLLDISQVSPKYSQMSPRCLPDISQMSPRYLPDVSQMSFRCLPVVSPDAFISQMSPCCLPHVSLMPPRCMSYGRRLLDVSAGLRTLSVNCFIQSSFSKCAPPWVESTPRW